MKYEEHVSQLEEQAYTFAEAVAASDPSVVVKTCPEWSVRDLARHVGQLYRWSSMIVDQGVRTETWPFQVPVTDPADDGWADWIRGAAGAALDVFRAADPSSRVWSWGADPHARFWPRRMLFETVVHRLDLDITNERPYEISCEVAVEGIDEWFENLRGVGRWRVPVTKIAGGGEFISFAAADSIETWRVQLVPHGWWWDRDPRRGAVHVSGSAADLLRLLQGRGADDARIEGDEASLERWLEATAF